MILVTSLPKETFSLADISALYRLHWRIEIAFKHLKSGTDLTRPPADTAAMAKAYVLAHRLLFLLTEPLIAEHLGASPRREAANGTASGDCCARCPTPCWTHCWLRPRSANSHPPLLVSPATCASRREGATISERQCKVCAYGA